MNAPDHLPDDELVSAVLDDEADDTTRERVAADPALAERLATFATIRDDIRQAQAPMGLLDELRLTVLDTVVPETPAAVTAPVFGLSARRARRAKAAGWISAAAAAVVLIAAIGFSTGGEDGDSSSDASLTASFATGSTGATATRESAADTAGGTAESNPSASASGTGAAGAPSSSLRDLGTVADLEALGTAYRAATTKAPTGSSPASTSSATGRSTGSTGSSAAVCGPAAAVAVLGSRPVLLVPDGAATLVVIDRATCAIIATITP